MNSEGSYELNVLFSNGCEMMKLTPSVLKDDISNLIESLSLREFEIPSRTVLFKGSFFVPLLSTFASVFGAILIYAKGAISYGVSDGIISFFISDGWVLVVPTVIGGLLFSVMAYNNLLIYFSLPEDIRLTSVVISHLRNLVVLSLKVFLLALFFLCVMSWYSPWLAVAIPVSQFLFLFVINIFIGSEINRLGIGYGMNKIVGLIKKI